MIHLLPGDVFFVMHKSNPISRVFAWFMGSNWSHSGIVLGNYRNEYITCETTDFEIALKTIGVYLNDPDCEIEVLRGKDFSEMEVEKMNLVGVGLQGKIYGYLQLISLGIRRILFRIKIRIGNFIKQDLVCCGVPIAVLSVTDQSLDIDPTSIDTEELYLLLKSRGWKTVFSK